jgi:hypothetical protein
MYSLAKEGCCNQYKGCNQHNTLLEIKEEYKEE